MFYDLNIPISNDIELTIELVKELKTFGYHGCAINHCVEIKKTPTANINSNKNKNKKKEPQVTKPSDKINQLEAKIQDLDKQNNQLAPLDFAIYTRMTFVAETEIPNKCMTAAKEYYDIISIEPQNENIFKQCCKVLKIDIITLNLNERLPFTLKKPLIIEAISRGIHFEILYSHMFQDSTARRNAISNSSSLVKMCKGKSIILSSGCAESLLLRNPLDAANLVSLFDMKMEDALNAISNNCMEIFDKSQKLNKSRTDEV